jgi:hypothetical protein
MKRVCSECGVESQRSGMSWKLWNQCVNCAKKTHGEHYAAKTCSECGATSNNTTALCWKIYNKCGKCAYKKPEHRQHIICKECNVYVYALRYNNRGSHKLELWYCSKCGCVISKNGYRILQVEGVLQ